MSDQRLRELERRWKETGSPDDEAAYLLERVRVGDLPRERLELAAYCGHEGARRAVGCAVPPTVSRVVAAAAIRADLLAESAVHAARMAAEARPSGGACLTQILDTCSDRRTLEQAIEQIADFAGAARRAGRSASAEEAAVAALRVVAGEEPVVNAEWAIRWAVDEWGDESVLGRVGGWVADRLLSERPGFDHSPRGPTRGAG